MLKTLKKLNISGGSAQLVTTSDKSISGLIFACCFSLSIVWPKNSFDSFGQSLIVKTQ